jgi:hypothetical protein
MKDMKNWFIEELGELSETLEQGLALAEESTQIGSDETTDHILLSLIIAQNSMTVKLLVMQANLLAQIATALSPQTKSFDTVKMN